MKEFVRAFLEREHAVRGAMPAECACLIGACMAVLSQRGARGNLLEIGVLDGRSFIPAALGLREDEKAVAVDPWEQIDQEISVTRGGTAARKNFEANLKAFGISDAQVVLHAQKSSAFRQSEAFRAYRSAKPFRFISIDGDHSSEATLLDLKIADEVASEAALIAIDDYFNIEWPSVSEATCRFLTECARWVPVCAGWNKLILTNLADAARLGEEIRAQMEAWSDLIRPRLNVIRAQPYFGAELCVFTNRWYAAQTAFPLPMDFRFGEAHRSRRQSRRRLDRARARLARRILGC